MSEGAWPHGRRPPEPKRLGSDGYSATENFLPMAAGSACHVLPPSVLSRRCSVRARILSMVAPSSSLQALALRLLAERVEAGGSISDGLARALAREVNAHPEDAEELAAAAALAGGQAPDWHLEVLEDRDAELGGESWDVVETRIRETLATRLRTA